jgi:transcriptional regulator with XRE-family HTH domain
MRVKHWRLKRKLTQQALADRVGIHRVYLAQLEAGTKTPSLGTLQRLAKALRVKVAALLD